MTDNPWPVNYNWDITSFEPQIRGVQSMIEFAHESMHNAFLLFVSSVATVSHLIPNGTVPEKLNHRYCDTADCYAASKHVAELLLEQKTIQSCIKVSFVRLKQIYGPMLRGKDKGV